MGLQERYSEDEIIIKEKSANKFMYMVLSGSVALYLNYGKTDEYLIGLCNKGTVFGEMGLLCHEESVYTAVAVNNVHVAIFSEFELGSFVRSYPDQALGIMRSVARMNKVLNMNMKMFLEEQKEDALVRDALSEALRMREMGVDMDKAHWHTGNHLREDTKHM